jgi:hypothetical protein
MQEHALNSMKSRLKTPWVSVILLLLIALPLQQMPSHHKKSFSAHRQSAISDFGGDNPGLEKRLKGSFHKSQPTGVTDQTTILLNPIPASLMNSRDIILSRQASALFSLHLLISQTSSSAS